MPQKKGLCGPKSLFYRCGAACQSRTDTPSRAADFESTASTISPRRHFLARFLPSRVDILLLCEVNYTKNILYPMRYPLAKEE